MSQSRVDDVRAYIENQEAHHQRVPFEEEFKRILSAHGIAFDERYLWG